MRYEVHKLLEQDLYYIRFFLGFRIEPRINLFFRMVVEDMVRGGEVDITSRYPSLEEAQQVGDFRFIMQESFLSFENQLSPHDKLILGAYMLLRKVSLNDQQGYGLDLSNVTVENVPLIISRPQNIVLERVPVVIAKEASDTKFDTTKK
jgi:KUP system potassium uptake protein